MIIGYFTMFPMIYKNHKVKDFNYILLLYMSNNNIPKAHKTLPIKGWERTIESSSLFGCRERLNMSAIKGFEVNVTVNMSVKAEEIKLSNNKKHEFDERVVDESAKGIDATVGATVELTIDEAEGDNIFGEIDDVISDEQVNQLTEKLADKLNKKEEKVDKGE